MTEMLAQITAPGKKGFCAGIVLRDDVVVRAAPILGYMRRRKFTRDEVRAYVAKRGWKITVVWERKETT